MANLREALCRLEKQVTIDVLSALYETPPMGPPGQPWYLNAVCGGSTELEPQELLASLKKIERGMGRMPTVRWGPRPIDIDLLFYDDLVLDSPELVIPHPGIPHRPFVLAPLADIAPHLIHPRLGAPIALLLDRLSDKAKEMRRIAEPGEWYPCMR